MLIINIINNIYTGVDYMPPFVKGKHVKDIETSADTVIFPTHPSINSRSVSQVASTTSEPDFIEPFIDRRVNN